MELNFEVVKNNIASGNYPDLIHFANTQAQLFNVDAGRLSGMDSDKIDNGEWAELKLGPELDVSPDTGMTNFEVKALSGFGIIGGYKTGNVHKLIIYEFAFEMDRYLSTGSIKHTLDNPISSFSLALENPDIGNPERPGNIVANEKTTLLSPGAKIEFKFGTGSDYPEFELGIFYVDKSSFELGRETVNVDGRNAIGKILKDQTLDENHVLPMNNLNETIRTLFENANLENYQYLIENTAQRNSFDFDRDKNMYAALEEILKATTNWKVAELADGTVVVGSPTYAGFEKNSTYTFTKGQDIFSRQIERDDGEAYSRVCVHDREYNVCIYRDADAYQGWNLQARKTYYVEVAEGTTTATATAYANEIANRLANVGKIESFTGPFRPHLLVGDEAVIVDGSSQSLGRITEVTHSFGKQGFSTAFVVDSGGRLGKGRLGDYIGQISARSRSSGSIGYEEEV